tara:strand:+ start:82 stop:582 length:501 start_codon:yes stop_codon:yes gene_type:complete
MKQNNYKLIKENWDNFVNEEEAPALFNEDGSIQEEEEALDEVVILSSIAWASKVAMAKLFSMLFIALKNKKDINLISQNLQGKKATPPKVKEALIQMDKALEAAEAASPAFATIADKLGGNWNPANWANNGLMAMIKSFMGIEEPAETPEEDDIDLTGMEAEPAKQ